MTPKPDKWLTTGTISTGGHGPVSLGKLEAGGGHLRGPRDLVIPMLSYKEKFYLRLRFSDFGKKE